MIQTTENLIAMACWRTIGTDGDRSCDRLPRHVHCRNCTVFGLAGRQLLDRPLPEDYRDQITRKLAEKPAIARPDDLTLMVFRVGSIWLALPADNLEESMSPVPVSRIPMRSNACFLGLVNTLGGLELCFSLKPFFSADPDNQTQADAARTFPRYLVVRLRGQRWVVTVDEVQGIVDCSRADPAPVPANLARSGHRLVTAFCDLQGQQVLIIDPARLAVVLEDALT